MHAGTEQLLAIRDGGLVDAGIAQHVADCADCCDRLAQLRTMGDALRGLPQLSPSPEAWSHLAARMDQPVARKNGWLGAAVAAAALLAVALWQFSGDVGTPSLESDQPDRVAMSNPAQLDVREQDLDALVSQSRQLEQVLRELNANRPRVMNAGTAGTIAGLQDGIAYIDYGLSHDEILNQSQSEQLWRQRVGLMNTLVQVRGAQLQQISN